MKKISRALAAAAISASLIAGGTIAAAPANAMTGFGIRTVSCPYGKTAQIDWKSTGNVNLFTFSSNAAYATETLVRQVYSNGSYSYNSGVRVLNWGFGVSPGNVSSYYERCVAFN